jgi:hypothetical protein
MTAAGEQLELTADEIESVVLTEEELEAVEEEELEEVEAEELEAAKRSLVNRILALVKQIVLKMLKNAGVAAKLRAAIRRGPAAVCRLICPVLCRIFPIFLRPICVPLCPVVCRRLFPWIRKVAGV